MRGGAVLLASLFAATGLAATAYVSDDLILGVYAEQNGQGARLATLHSGASVEVLAASGDFTQVQLADGTTGWVKSSFLITREPAAARVKELEDELSRTRATTPELAEAAARSEALQLKSQLATVQSELESARAAAASRGNVSSPTPRDDAGRFLQLPWPIWLATASAAVLCGFWWGYLAMARRVRRKFGGIKVY